MSAAANDSWETRAGRGAAGTPPLYSSGRGLGLGLEQGARGHHNNTATITLQTRVAQRHHTMHCRPTALITVTEGEYKRGCDEDGTAG